MIIDKLHFIFNQLTSIPSFTSTVSQVHKLLKLQIKPGQESELCHMIIDCCAQQRTYEKFFGLMGQRFCQVCSFSSKLLFSNVSISGDQDLC